MTRCTGWRGSRRARSHQTGNDLSGPGPARFGGDARHLAAIALPVGGIGTGTISLDGRGRWQDWEIQNRPAKGAHPEYGFFGVFEQEAGRRERGRARILEASFEPPLTGSRGIDVSTGGLPRFERAAFESVYPFGRLELSDPESELEVELEAWNPLLPGDEDLSGIPVAIVGVRIRNLAATHHEIAVAGCLSSLLADPHVGWETREEAGLRDAVLRGRNDRLGSMAIACLGVGEVAVRTGWRRGWKDGLLQFWDAFSSEGRLPDAAEGDEPVAQVVARATLDRGVSCTLSFLLGWSFPIRIPWGGGTVQSTMSRQVRNHYATRFADAWDVLSFVGRRFGELAEGTRDFADAVWTSDLPLAVREAAMCSLTALRSETTFRAEDGRLYRWEGCDDLAGCCHGTCTHVWNYEWATPLLFDKLARSMRDTEFRDSTRDDGSMAFRSGRPDPGRLASSFAAADGQFGCIVKLYRERRLCADDAWLGTLWPRARAVVESANRVPPRTERAIIELERVVSLSGKVVEQIRQRLAGEKITDRLVSLFDPDARPIRKGKKDKPTQFGGIVQYTEPSPNTRRGARACWCPPRMPSATSTKMSSCRRRWPRCWHWISSPGKPSSTAGSR